MKEKKNILMMMFSIAFIELILGVIFAFFESFYGMKGQGYRVLIGVLELFTAILGIVFCTFYVLEFFMDKKDWLIKAQNVSAIVVLAFFILFAIVSRITVSIIRYASESTFLGFLNVSLRIIITEMIVFVSSFYIKRIKRKELEEEKKAQEQQSVEKQTLEQQPAEQEETI